VIAGDKLNKHDEIIKISGRVQMKKRLMDTAEMLEKKLWAIEEKGQTALGPALLSSISIASANGGGQVVLCTDGLANIGLGSFDKQMTEQQRDSAENWWVDVGLWAKSLGVRVNIITIVGQEARLEDIGKVADATSGTITRVDAAELNTQFMNCLLKPVVATHVQATLLLHPGLMFRDLVSESRGSLQKSSVTRDIGNVTEDSEITFEYSVRRGFRDPTLTSLPFQLLIYYTRMDGARYLRCVTQVQSVTKSRVEAEKEARVELIAANSAQISAQLAEAGMYDEAVQYNQAQLCQMSSLSAHSAKNERVFQNWNKKAVKFTESCISNANAPLLQPMSSSSAFAAPLAKKKCASRARNDEQFSEIHNRKSASSADYEDKPDQL